MPHRSVYENRVKPQGGQSAQGFFQRSAVIYVSDRQVGAEEPNTEEKIQSSHFQQNLSLIPTQASEDSSLPRTSFSHVQVCPPIQMKLTIGQPKDRFAPIQKMDWQSKKTNKPKKTMEEEFDEIDLMLDSLNWTLPTPQENLSPEKKQSSSLSSLKELTAITATRGQEEERKQIEQLFNEWEHFYKDPEKKEVLDQPYTQNRQIQDQNDRQDILASTVRPQKGKETEVDNLTGLHDMKGNLQALGSWRVEIEILEKEVPYVYIEDLASAPWNVWNRNQASKDPRAVEGGGTAWICEMIKISQNEGCEGRLRLNAFASSPGFYQKLGFTGTELGTGRMWKYKKNSNDKTPEKGGAELTSEAARNLLERNK
jgi:hypothetical protein